ncbi:MAG: phosphoribosylformylglycinamidine cyclo-ligase [Nitrospirae bacterium]|nr:MAG: phosphoribosylformylglycinamidine cyclo-ligase [Nitrospirota bacterium]
MTTYRDSGVDIEAGDAFIQRIKPLVRTTFRPEVLGDVGGFGGLFRFPTDKYEDPVLVSGTDGVGTKLRVALQLDRHDTIGIDLVAMCVNDVVVTGAEPLFFLDYLAMGKLHLEKAEAIVRGIVAGCREAGCALIGGETAEMPASYPDDEYDLAGFAVGVVERSRLIDGARITVSDRVIGVASTGLHSNGFSLARRVLFEKAGLRVESRLPRLSEPVGEALLTPTRIYAKLVHALLAEHEVHGMAHITGGGITGNLPRILPSECRVRIDPTAWKVPPIFTVIQELGDIAHDEMFRVFNMGIGLVLVVPSSEVDPLLRHVQQLGQEAWVIGAVDKRPHEAKPLIYESERYS